MKRRYLWFLALVVLAFGLASCGSSAAETAAPADQPTTAAASDASSGGSVVADSNAVVLTQDNAGQSVDVTVGQEILVKMGEDHTWAVNVTPAFLVTKIEDATLNADEQGLYTTKMNGRATVQLTGTPTCASDNPPCTDGIKQFNITVIINK